MASASILRLFIACRDLSGDIATGVLGWLASGVSSDATSPAAWPSPAADPRMPAATRAATATAVTVKNKRGRETSERNDLDWCSISILLKNVLDVGRNARAGQATSASDFRRAI